MVSPDTRQPLELHGIPEKNPEIILSCPSTGQKYIIRDGIPIFIEWDDGTAVSEFEHKYQFETEPWSYNHRAAEMLRHEYVAQTLKTVQPGAKRVLDLGCSLGQLSQKLGEVYPTIVSLDVSLTAVLQARKNLAHCRADYTFVVASAAALPFGDNSFDCVVASDGLHAWEISRHVQKKAIGEIERILQPGAFVLLTDYLHPQKFPQLITLVEESPLVIKRIDYLNDRLWYQVESWLHRVQNAYPVRALLRNFSFARLLRRISALRGINGSKHIAILAQKKSHS